MITLVSFLFLGFFLGMRHATDADHVVAVTTIISRQQRVRDAALIGVFWGLGHTVTLVVVGGAMVLLGLVIPQKLGAGLELGVAAMLVFLGFINLRLMFRWGQKEDFEDRLMARLDQRFNPRSAYRALRPMVIGIVHGLAGSAAVALLVLPVIQTPGSAMAYLLVFGAGTIAGMLLITAALALPISLAAKQSPSFQRYIGATAGLVSIAFGSFLFWQIGFAQGLFVR